MDTELIIDCLFEVSNSGSVLTLWDKDFVGDREKVVDISYLFLYKRFLFFNFSSRIDDGNAVDGPSSHDFGNRSPVSPVTID